MRLKSIRTFLVGVLILTFGVLLGHYIGFADGIAASMPEILLLQEMVEGR